jgi:uncharacterized membrane protein YraQ (UPF0718 family)/copper chaperone CopZ
MPELAWKIVAGFWGVLGEMAPYLLLGFVVAGLLSILIRPEWVELHLGGRGFWPVLKAAAFGVPLPLCSCGVIPVSASLRQHGASRGATTSFLISTPQTGVDSIFVTYSLLGGVFAIYRPIAALVSGVLGGMLVDMTQGKDPPPQDAPPQAKAPQAGKRPLRARIRDAWTYGLVTLPRDIGWALIFGLVVAALLSAIVPEDFFAGSLGAAVGPVGTILLMMLIGIPIYVCATASVPIAAALIHMGVSPGAAFAFLVTGPGTNAATVSTVWKVMGPRSAIMYLLTLGATGFGGGLLLDQFAGRQEVMHVHHAMGGTAPGIASSVAAVALIAVMAYALVMPYVRRTRSGRASRGPDMAEPCKLSFQVTGMTCSHCVATVKRAILACPGVRWAEVDLKEGLARCSGEGMDFAQVRRAVEGLGYGVQGPQKGET